MTARDYLQQLQAAAGFVDRSKTAHSDPLDLGEILLDSPEFWAGRYRSRMPELKNFFSIDNDDFLDEIELRWSKYEDIQWLAYITELMKEIEVAMRAHKGGEEFPKITIGTLPIGSLNALAVAVPQNSEEYIIAVSRGLIPFLGYASMILGHLFRTERKTDHFKIAFTRGWRDRLSLRLQLRTLGNRFGTLVSSFVTNDFTQLTKQKIDQKRMPLATEISHIMGIFILAHEIAHVLHGHTLESKTVATVLGGEPIRTYWRKWAYELFADQTALRITLMVANKTGVPGTIAYMAIHYLLNMIEITDRALNILNQGKDMETGVGSHPPASLRKEWLRVFAQQQSPDEAELLRFMTRILIWRLDSLWEKSRNNLFEIWEKKAAQDGQKLGRVDKTFYAIPLSAMNESMLQESEPKPYECAELPFVALQIHH